MGQFNPFYRNNGGGGGSGGTSEVVRYSIEKSIQDSKTVFKLKQTINGVSSYVGNVITFDAADISFDSEKATTVEEALEYLLNFTEGNYNFTTFEELGINTTGKTMEQILSEVLSKNLPVNTIITGQIYTSAAPDLGWNNAEAKIQITEGGAGQQIYWCSVSSIEIEPYQWNSIYYEKQSDSSIQETLGWTPTYYELPTASKDEKGGILVGDTLTIDSNGVLNINLSNIKSIEKIEFTSSTEGVLPAIEGATDTYTIYYTDGTTFTYQIQNGVKGTNGEDGITPQFNVTDTAIQVSTDNGVTYSDLILLSEITGAAGENGITPIFRTTSTAIQVSIDNGVNYTDLIQISDITGENGQDGNDGISVTSAIINSNGHLIITLSDGNEIDAGEAKGKDGTSINIKDSLSSTDELPSTGQSIGDAYLIDGNIWIYTNSTDEGSVNGFKNAGNIQGPEGRGISSVTINDSGQLEITYSDSTSAVIGNVVGPQGEQGLQGEKGDTGENGLSAYDIFKLNNPESTLTESEWISSLKGEKGEQGEKGEDGTSITVTSTTKVDGITTIIFSDGTSIEINDGQNGTNGSNGKSLEFNWNGTELGIRVEGNTDYTYVNLKGETGDTGATGENGADGIGIEKIEFTSSTGGETAGIAGATDTYTITLTDSTTTTFIVYNGKDGGDGHTHENKDILDKLGEENGELTYNGNEVFRVWHGTKEEYDAISEKDENWTYIITDDGANLSEFTNELKEKLDSIETGANKTEVDSLLSSTSINPVQNKVIFEEFEKYLPLSGGTMDANSMITIPGTNNRYVVLMSSGVRFKVATGSGWAQGLTYYDTDGTTVLCQIGVYGNDSELKYIYIGGTYENPLVKITPDGTIICPNLSGNASTATKLQTARTINGVSFDGTEDITIHETDSGWKNLILGETGQIRYRKVGSTVEVKGQYKPATSGGGFTIGTLPEGYRPSTYKAVAALANESNNMIFIMRVYTDGTVNISGYSASTFDAGTVYDLHIQYFVD